MLKLCYSKAVTSTVDWDNEIGHELSEEWDSLVSEIEFLLLFTFPRQYSWLKEGKYEVHVFTDASNYAMGACVYLTKRCGNIMESSLVLGKSRLFPQTQVSRFSIARKELLGLCMGADLLNQCIIHFTISITEIYVWVDSVAVATNSLWPMLINYKVFKTPKFIAA